MHDKQKYLDTACHQVRFKAARKYLRQELAAHIDDKKEHLKRKAYKMPKQMPLQPWATLLKQAVRWMRSTSRAHRMGRYCKRCSTQYRRDSCAGPDRRNDMYFASNMAYQQQLLGVTIGFCIMLGMMFFDYTRLLRLRHVLYSAAILLFIVQRYLIAIQINGSYFRYSTPGILTETIIPVLFLLAVAGYIQSNKKHGFAGLIKITLLSMVSILLIMLMPDFASVCILQLVFLILIFTAIRHCHFYGKRRALQYIIIFGSITAMILILLLIVSPGGGWFERMLARLSIGTYYNAEGEGYAVSHVREMLQGSKFIGSSDYYLANQTEFMPYSRTSYIFSCIIGIYGWLVGIVIFLIFGALLPC